MAISIHKKLRTFEQSPGYLVVEAILDNGTEKRKVLLGGVPNDDAGCESAILARGEELFNNNGVIWSEAGSLVNTSEKIVRGKDWAKIKSDVASSNSVPALRAIVAELVEAVEALKDRL